MHFFSTPNMSYPTNSSTSADRPNGTPGTAPLNRPSDFTSATSNLPSSNMYNCPQKMIKLESHSSTCPPSGTSNYHSPLSSPSNLPRGMPMPPMSRPYNSPFMMPPTGRPSPNYMSPHFSTSSSPATEDSIGYFSSGNPHQPSRLPGTSLAPPQSPSIPGVNPLLLRQQLLSTVASSQRSNHHHHHHENPMQHLNRSNSENASSFYRESRMNRGNEDLASSRPQMLSSSPLQSFSATKLCNQKVPASSPLTHSEASVAASEVSEPMSQPPASSAPTNTSESPPLRTHRIGRRCKPKEDRRCGVCGDKALSCNFDALTCESCKAFFRRNASKDVSSFKCPYKGMCNITVGTRRLCKQCRIRRCFDIGMKKEYILSTEERSEKQQKIRQNKILKKLEERNWIAKDLSMAELSHKSLLTETEIHLIDEVVEAYDASLWVKLEKRAGSREAPSIADLINLAEISIRRAIEMFKRVKAFRTLDKKAQIILLKGGCIELLVIRGVISYDPVKRRFLDSVDNENSDSMSLENVMMGAGGEAGTAFQRLIQTLLLRMQCCRVTMILMLLICLFSNRAEFMPLREKTDDDAAISGDTTSTIQPSDPPPPTAMPTVPLLPGGSDTETSMSTEGATPGTTTETSDLHAEVERLQLMYSHLLKKFLSTKWSVKKADRLFPQIMLSLSDLSTINEFFSRQMMHMNVNSVTPLMTEMLDIPVVPYTGGRVKSSCHSSGHDSSHTSATSASGGGESSYSSTRNMMPASAPPIVNERNTTPHHWSAIPSVQTEATPPPQEMSQPIPSVAWTPSSAEFNDSLFDPTITSTNLSQ